MEWKMIGQKTQTTTIGKIGYRIDAALVARQPNWQIKRQCLVSGRWDVIGNGYSVEECEKIIMERHEFATKLHIKC